MTISASAGGGSGDVTDVFNCASGDCASVTMADGDLLSAASINPNTTTEGMILPQATACTGATAEGQICWKTDTDKTWGDRTVTVERNRGWGDRSQRSPTFWNKEEPDGPQEAA